MMSTKAFIRDAVAMSLEHLQLSKPSLRFRDHLFIVTFHRVLPEEYRQSFPLPGLAVTPQEFEWYLEFYCERFQVERLDNAWHNHSCNVKSKLPKLAITFDDGQLDNYLYAAPILDRLGIPATFFIPVQAIEEQKLLWHDRMGYAIQQVAKAVSEPTLLNQLNIDKERALTQPWLGVANAKQWTQLQREEWIGRVDSLIGSSVPSWDGMMAWSQISDLAERGHEIGSHSSTHPILVQCGDAQLEDEIVGSRCHLEKNLNIAVSSFCYPNGDSDIRVRSLVRKAGYKLAVTTQWGSNSPGTESFSLKRHDMVAKNTLDRKGILSSARLAMRMTSFKRAAS